MLAAALCGCYGARGQTFSNTTTAACDAWNSGNAYTGFQRTIAVSGMPSPLGPTEAVLRQVNLRLGSASCKGNLSTYYARIISPAGTIIQLFGNSAVPVGFSTTITEQWMDIKFRDDPALERVRDYSTITQQGYHPWSIGYHRTEVANVFATVNGEDPNGNWTLQIAENTASEVSFERVDLVFGPPIRVKDVTGTSANSDCAGSTCIDAVEVVRGTNNGYSELDPLYPGNTVGGCSWNGANNNSGWYRFKATGTTAYITVSGMANASGTTSADMQLLIVEAPPWLCASAPTVVPTGGCPDDQPRNNSAYIAPNGGSTAGNVYVNGITANTEFNLSGLVPGQDYNLIIDGNGGVSSTFYIEMAFGGLDCITVLPIQWGAIDVECEGGGRRIAWTAGSQTGNDRFVVERSTDLNTWTAFATVPGAGTTSVPMRYAVVDDVTDLIGMPNVLYYRVKQVDLDGTAAHSRAVPSSCRMVVYPNPTSDRIVVVLPPGAERVEVYDAIGRLVLTHRTQGSALELDLSGLASGQYAVRVLGAGALLAAEVLIRL